MLRTIIIENGKAAIKHLSGLLKKHCRQRVELIGHFTTAVEGLQGIQTLQPQLVFLNTEMDGKTGFDLLQHLPEKNFEVIFITATDKYALQAFQYNAVDYLLKPIKLEALLKAVEKISIQKPMETLSNRLENLVNDVEQLKQYTPLKKLMVPTISGFELLPVIDILRCESEINYTTIYLKDRQKLVVAKTLKEFEALLSEYNFFRIHNSHLINLAYIKSYNKGKGGYALLTDGSAVEVSTRKKNDFLQKLATL